MYGDNTTKYATRDTIPIFILNIVTSYNINQWSRVESHCISVLSVKLPNYMLIL